MPGPPTTSGKGTGGGSGGTCANSPQLLCLAGRTGTNNDANISTTQSGSITGSTASGFGLNLSGNSETTLNPGDSVNYAPNVTTIPPFGGVNVSSLFRFNNNLTIDTSTNPALFSIFDMGQVSAPTWTVVGSNPFQLFTFVGVQPTIQSDLHATQDILAGESLYTNQPALVARGPGCTAGDDGFGLVSLHTKYKFFADTVSDAGATLAVSQARGVLDRLVLTGPVTVTNYIGVTHVDVDKDPSGVVVNDIGLYCPNLHNNTATTIFASVKSDSPSRQMLHSGPVRVGDDTTAALLKLADGSAHDTTITTQTQAGTVAYTLPAANASGVLTNNGSGLLSWTPGSAGSQGPQGMPGLDGQDGADGEPGPIGATGPRGLQGLQGFPGLDGEDGSEGPQGPAGPTGATGPTGPTGPTGETGATGATGMPGLDADVDDSGFLIPSMDLGPYLYLPGRGTTQTLLQDIFQLQGTQQQALLYNPSITITSNLIKEPIKVAGTFTLNTGQSLVLRSLFTQSTLNINVSPTGLAAIIALETTDVLNLLADGITGQGYVAVQNETRVTANAGSSTNVTQFSLDGFHDYGDLNCLSGNLTCTTMTGLEIFPSTGTSTGTTITVGTKRGVYYHDFNVGGTGTTAVTTNVAFDIDAQTYGTTKRSIRSSGTDVLMTHAGGARFGDTTAPTEKLEVAGNAVVTGHQTLESGFTTIGAATETALTIAPTFTETDLASAFVGVTYGPTITAATGFLNINAAFRSAPSVTNSGSDSIIPSLQSFQHAPTFTTAIASTGLADTALSVNPTFQKSGSGTWSGATSTAALSVSGSVASGLTVASRFGMSYNAHSGAGAVTTDIGYDCVALLGTNNLAVRAASERIQAYSVPSFTVQTGYYAHHVKQLGLTGSNRATIAGTARVYVS